MTRDERQEVARKKWMRSKCTGTIVMPTGTGKTRTALKALKRIIDNYPNMRILVVVPTTTLKSQWEAQLPDYNLLFATTVEVINSVIKHESKYDILVLDEIHKYAANTFSEVFTKVTYKYVLGLTATFERLDKKHEILAKYCPIVDKITTIEAQSNGWISNYKEYLVLIDVDDIDVYRGYDAQYNEHFGFFSYDWNLASSMLGKQGFIQRAKLRDEMCKNCSDAERKATFTAITSHAAQFMRAIQNRKAFVNNHPKKIEIARKIIDSRFSSKIITFSNNVRMAEAIGNGPVYTGKDSKKHSAKTMELFKLQSSGVIHSVKKLIEGADVPGLSVAIILGQDSSETRATQARGRVIRKEGDKQAEIFNIVVNNTVETKWFQSSHKNSPYITIDEHGLEQVLRGETPDPYIKKIKDYALRY